MRASASSWWRRWPPAPRWWPATWTPSGAFSNEGEAGRLVPVDDADALADSLIELLRDDDAAAALCRRRVRGGAPLRLVGGGRRDHAGVRDGQRCGCQGPGEFVNVILIVVLVLVGVVLLLTAQLGLSDRQPAGPAARALRPVLARARRRAGASCGGGAGGRRGRVRQRSGGQTAGRAGRRRRTSRSTGPRGRRERPVRGVGDGRPGRTADRAGGRTGRRRGAGVAGPPLPQRRRPRHPVAA